MATGQVFVEDENGQFIPILDSASSFDTKIAAMQQTLADQMIFHARVVKGEHSWCECRMWNNKCTWSFEDHMTEVIHAATKL
jgi:hypothetical protein